MQNLSRPGGPEATSRNLIRRLLPVLIFLIYISFFSPFWKAIVGGVIFACGCSPMVTWMKGKLNLRRNVSSYIFISVATIVLLLCLTVFFTSMYSFLTEVSKNSRQFLNIDFAEMLVKIEDQVLSFLGLEKGSIVTEVFDTVKKTGQNIDVYITSFAREFVQNVPDFLLQLFIFFLVFFGLIIYRGKIYVFISELVGFHGQELNYISRFEQMCARTLGSIFVIGIIQSIIVLLGISLTHASDSKLFLFNLTFVFSLIPLLGAAIIPFVISVSNFINGNLATGIILLITAAIAGSIDNVLKGIFFSRAANSNAVLSLIALLGSLALFGFIGLFMAPVVEQIIMAMLGSQVKKAEQAKP